LVVAVVLSAQVLTAHLGVAPPAPGLHLPSEPTYLLQFPSSVYELQAVVIVLAQPEPVVLQSN
jgi:hypothetical protein